MSFKEFTDAALLLLRVIVVVFFMVVSMVQFWKTKSPTDKHTVSALLHLIAANMISRFEVIP